MKQREENSLRWQTRAKMDDTPLPAGELTRPAISVYISLEVYQRGIAPYPCGKGAAVLRTKQRTRYTRLSYRHSGEHHRMPRI